MEYTNRKHAKDGRIGATKKTEKILLYAIDNGIPAAVKKYEHLYSNKNSAMACIHSIVKRWGSTITKNSNTRGSDSTKANILQLVRTDKLDVNEALTLLNKVS